MSERILIHKVSIVEEKVIFRCQLYFHILNLAVFTLYKQIIIINIQYSNNLKSSKQSKVKQSTYKCQNLNSNGLQCPNLLGPTIWILNTQLKWRLSIIQHLVSFSYSIGKMSDEKMEMMFNVIYLPRDGSISSIAEKSNALRTDYYVIFAPSLFSYSSILLL